ncbi:MAG: hypothetical protein M0Z70_12970 [Nitrospiraceae bacterium]|nr:hypothetical protein [Nitrospiraceae bacterium]
MGMFSDLSKIVDLIRSVLRDLQKIKAKKEREKAVFDVLKTYFLMKDIVDDGIRLISSAGDDPVRKIEEMNASHAIRMLEEWDLIIRRQGKRLYILQGYIYG